MVVIALAALLFATVATSEPVPLAERAPSMPFTLPEIDLADEATTTTLADDDADDVDPDQRFDWSFATTGLEYLVLASLVVAVALALAHGWRNRPHLVWHRRKPDTAYVVLEEVADRVVDDAEEQRRALRRGTARNAIVECWLRLEAMVEASGVAHDPALTPTEFTTAALGRFDVDAAAADRLAALYREARFSSHDLGEGHRDAALAALDVLHEGLRRARPTTVADR